MNNKAGLLSLLPIGIFLFIFIGCGLIIGDFYAVPAIVAFLIALLVAFLQNRNTSFEEKIKIAAKETGNENILTMCFIFLAAGAFSSSVTAAGGVDSIVNLGLSVIPPKLAVAGMFGIACIISLSMGTSMGTVAALSPIALGISQKAGIPLSLCMGSVMCGAMFGDNLSVISDTTIAATKTQGCEMKDKFRENFFIVLPAAIITVVIFVATARGSTTTVEAGSYNIIKIIPYLMVLAGALAGINVFTVLITGTVASLIIGVGYGDISPAEIFAVTGNGVTSMYDITIISIVVSAIVGLIKSSGGIDYVLKLLTSRVKTPRGAQLSVAFLALAVDICTANNTVAIVVAGPIAKQIGKSYGISPKRNAALLDIFASVGQGLIPYGAQLLAAASLTGITPFEIIPYMYYPVLMAVSALVFIAISKPKDSGSPAV